MTVQRNLELKKELKNQIKHYVKKCQKIPCYMRICATQFAGCLLLKKLKHFEVMLNIFEFSQVW